MTRAPLKRGAAAGLDAAMICSSRAVRLVLGETNAACKPVVAESRSGSTRASLIVRTGKREATCVNSRWIIYDWRAAGQGRTVENCKSRVGRPQEIYDLRYTIYEIYELSGARKSHIVYRKSPNP